MLDASHIQLDDHALNSREYHGCKLWNFSSKLAILIFSRSRLLHLQYSGSRFKAHATALNYSFSAYCLSLPQTICWALFSKAFSQKPVLVCKKTQFIPNLNNQTMLKLWYSASVRAFYFMRRKTTLRVRYAEGLFGQSSAMLSRAASWELDTGWRHQELHFESFG